MKLDQNQQTQLLALKGVAVDQFTAGNWTELGMLTGCLEEVRQHQRLLRSLSFGDDDYPDHALDMLLVMAARAPENFSKIENYVLGINGDAALPSVNGGKMVLFKPSVFEVPDQPADPNLVAIMMPFQAEFASVHAAIMQACVSAGLNGQRVDDIWQHSVVMQDVFSLIWRAKIVVCDFTGRNANVFYEAGIAHTLGKPVVPITQQKADVPFDLQHHRFLQYLPNREGYADLAENLGRRLGTLAS